MKKIYTLVLILSLAASAYAQDFMWAKNAGLWAYDYGYGVGTDAAGNVYVAGKYEENAVFDQNTTVTCAGNHDIYVAKYSSVGALQWVRTGGGPDGDYARAIAVDAAGNVYVTGEIEGTAMFGTTQVNGHPGTNDAFVAKYDTNGNLLWANYYGGYSDDKARSIAIDPTGNIYITGEYMSTATFGSFTLTSNGGSEDIFVAKLDGSGNCLWAKSAGGSDHDGGKGIKADATGAYVAGYFYGAGTFGSTTLNAPNGFADMFVAKYDASNGNVSWVKQAGGNYDDVAWGIAIDNAGNSYLTGEFNADAYFDSQQIITAGNADVFVAKYDNAGALSWVQRFGGNIIDRGRGIATDGVNVVFTGQYSGTVTVGSHTVTAADSSDIFIASFSAATGSGNWVIAPHGDADAYENLGYESGNAIHIDNAGYVYVTGSYLDGDSLNYFYLAPWSRTDMFVAKIDPGLVTNPSGINDLSAAGNVSVMPNPSTGWVNISFSSPKTETYTLQVTNALGQVVYKETVDGLTGNYNKKIDLSAYGKGLYLLNISGAGTTKVQKVMID